MNMFKPSGAETIEEYFAMLEPSRREQLETLDKLIKETVPDLKPWFTYNMLGYGAFDYVNYKKDETQWPLVAMASQKNYMSLYVCALHPKEKEKYIAEVYAEDLYQNGAKPYVGKSCIRFKNIEDLNLETLKKVLKEAAKNPGLVGPEEKK